MLYMGGRSHSSRGTTTPPPCRWPPLVAGPPLQNKETWPPSRCPPPLFRSENHPPPPPPGFLPKSSQCRAFFGSTLLEDGHAKFLCSYN